MNLTAFSKSKNKKICIIDYKEPRTEIEKGDIICPYCKIDMHVIAGNIKINHFRHKIKCTNNVNKHPESPEHLLAKEIIGNYIKDLYKDYKVHIEYEYYLIDVNREIDIAVVFPYGWVEAHEIQLSSITVEEIQKRTEDYANEGITVTWWLGKSAATPAITNWNKEIFGSIFLLDYEKISEEVKNRISEGNILSKI